MPAHNVHTVSLGCVRAGAVVKFARRNFLRMEEDVWHCGQYVAPKWLMRKANMWPLMIDAGY